MSTRDQPGRNDPCPCGSGKKFKACCAGRHDIVEEARRTPWLIGGVAVVGLAAVATVVLHLGETPPPAPVSRSLTPPAPSRVPRPMPRPVPQPAPVLGAAGNGQPIPIERVPSGQPVPQPPGPVPPGKVWSPEHGHYHDLPPPVAQGSSGTTQGTTQGSNGAIGPSPTPVDPGLIPPHPVDPPAPPPETPGPK